MAALPPPVQGPALGCHYCFKDPALKICGSCKISRYCSGDCQKLSWTTHKVWCQSKNALDIYRAEHPVKKLPLVLCFAAYDKLDRIPPAINETLYNEKIATLQGGRSSEEVETLAHVPTSGPTIMFEDLDGSRRILTQEEYFQKFGTYFVKGVHVFGEEAITFLTQNHRQPNGFTLDASDPNEFPPIERFRSSPPPLVVRMESPEECPQMGLGLFATTFLPKGTIVCSFGGHLTAEKRHSRKSYLDSISCEVGPKIWQLDQAYTSGTGRFMNDGPANLAPVRLCDSPQRAEELLVYITLRDVNEGEALHTYYGPTHPIRQQEYAIPAPYEKELALFCREHLSSARLLKNMFDSFAEMSLATLHKIGMIKYIFSNTKVLTNLILKQALNGDLAQIVMSQPLIVDELQTCNLSHPNRQKIIKNMMTLVPNRELIALFLKETEVLCQAALSSLILEIDPINFPLTAHSLPLFIAKARLFQEVVHYMNAKLMFREPEEEGKEEPLDFNSFSQRYAALPSALRNETIPEYIGSYLPYAEPHKHACLGALTTVIFQLNQA